MPEFLQDPGTFKTEFTRLKCCVLIPTFNNASKLEQVIRDVATYTNDIVIVNDGSKDSTEDILLKYPQLKIARHEKNAGKGVALQTGFRFALSNGYHYAITIDSDGQHMAYDLPKFLNALENSKNTIFIGSRNMDQSHIPGKSSYGNKFSNFWFKVITGINVPDTQSGYRLYPLIPLQKMKFFTKKYEFEIEVLVRSSWAKMMIGSIPIDVYYPPKNERITHFRPFTDFTRITILNTGFVVMAFFYYIPLRFFKGLKKKA